MPEKEKKNRVLGSNPGSCVFTSTAVKTLTACAIQAIAGRIIQIEVVSCTDTIKYISFFLFS